jgi:hypothetical protein
MRKYLLIDAILFCVVSILLTAGARRVAAQGPAGAGAADAAKDSSHSYNPMHWIKKDSKDSTDALGGRSEAERKLTPILQSEGVLAANDSATAACTNFANLEECLAALHATHDLGLKFICVQASVTGVHTSTDLSGCKDVDESKPQSLNKAIHLLKPEANAKEAAKSAEQEAKADLEKIGG